MNVDLLLRDALNRAEPPARLAALTRDASPVGAIPLDLSGVLSLWPHLEVSVEDIDGDGYLVEFGHRGGQILIKEGVSRTRRRFSLAHELGHWVLALSEEVRESWAPERVEKWCDEYARELLIPAHELRRRLSDVASVRGPTVARLPSEFQVSVQAMWIQCSDQRLLSIVMAGKTVSEYSSSVLSPSQRVALVRAAMAVRDRGTPPPETLGPWPVVSFRGSVGVVLVVVHSDVS